MENTKLWDELSHTDPKHTKKFKRAGGFGGTAIKPMFSYRRMTEVFGPCGIAWGVNEPSFQVVAGDNKEVLVYCTASIWHGDKQNIVYGVGGDKVVTHIKANAQDNRPERWENDDEAFKKAFTDAVTNALKLIGVGADVHMGMFDDNKYVNDMKARFGDEQKSADKPAEAPTEARPMMDGATYTGLLSGLKAARDAAQLANAASNVKSAKLIFEVTPQQDSTLAKAYKDAKELIEKGDEIPY